MHRATFSVSTIVSPFPLIRHVHGVPRRQFFSTTRTRVSYPRPNRYRRHIRRNNRRKIQLCAPIAHGISNRITSSSPQYASIFSAHARHATLVLCYNTMRIAYPTVMNSECLSPPGRKTSIRPPLLFHTMRLWLRPDQNFSQQTIHLYTLICNGSTKPTYTRNITPQFE